MQYIVITSIQSPTSCVEKFANLQGWEVIVVGDKKTPHWKNPPPNCTYIGEEEQRAVFGKLADEIPWNNYARKNLGYLYAIQRGAKVIYESDDDNYPLRNWQSDTVFPDAPDAVIGSGVVNILKHFSDTKIWPRGLPLDLISDDTPLVLEKGESLKGQDCDVGVMQWLANGNPDVDAIYRMLHRDIDVTFTHKPPVVLSKGLFTPSNSQNTLWSPKTFPLMYLPSYVDMRFTDILRGYVAQKCLWSIGSNLGYGSATVAQDRNPHDLMRDFSGEISCYLNTKTVLDCLSKLNIEGVTAVEAIIRCYEILCEHDIVPYKEVSLLTEWLSRMNGINYKYDCLLAITDLYPQYEDKIQSVSVLSDCGSQLAQDIFVLSELDFKNSGFFVEFGAADGKTLSNTYLLEQMGWNGILAEPARMWHEGLAKNRKASLDYDCVWSASNDQLIFTETVEQEFSAISGYLNPNKEVNSTYKVNSISLTDLLVKHGAPKVIDYLSIDTEGSEYDILNSFDFDRFKIKIITCEHNYTEQRDKIESLLASKGYVKVLADKTLWDDWYIWKE